MDNGNVTSYSQEITISPTNHAKQLDRFSVHGRKHIQMTLARNRVEFTQMKSLRDGSSLPSWLVFENAICVCLLGFDLICLVLASIVRCIYYLRSCPRPSTSWSCHPRPVTEKSTPKGNFCSVLLQSSTRLSACNLHLIVPEYDIIVCLCLSEYTSAGILSSAFISLRVYLPAWPQAVVVKYNKQTVSATIF